MSFYITTPIYYVNAQPHLGHAFTTIVADVVSRFRRLAGEEVRFQTGTDEHGDKVVEAAVAAGLSPLEYADRISDMFRSAWPPLDIRPDTFIRTTEPHHVKVVQHVLQEVYDRGDIYLGDYTGLYCKGCERFLTEKELTDGKCPDHQVPPVLISEHNYFFRMSRYQEWLVNHITDNPDFITPERYRNEVLSFLRDPLEDLCISRPVSRLSWGIPLPFDDDFVTYVWFDALINYLTGIGYPDDQDFSRFWNRAEHIIAKDILKPHAIYWPTMLRAIGLPPYKRLHVHGYWNINEAKMSKSIGNVVRPGDLLAEFGPDSIRYFLLREMSFGLDSSFSFEALRDRHNSDLANDLGNLFSRSLTMISKFSGGVVPEPAARTEAEEELIAAVEDMLSEYSSRMKDFGFSRALQSVWQVIGLANRYIVGNAPWELAKDPAAVERLATVLYSLAETLRLVALVLQPIMPSASRKMAAALGLPTPAALGREGRWGGIKPGTAVTAGQPLFPRLETKGGTHKKSTAAGKGDKQSAGQVSFEDFQKLDLQVAEVLAAEPVPKADRLLKLTVKAAEERTLVAGIAESYKPEELVGRQVIIVANLKPAKIKGVTSQGMVLAARDKNGRLVLTGPEQICTPGSRVS